MDGGADGLPWVGAAVHSARLTFLLCGIGVAGIWDASESHSSSAGALGALVLAGLGAGAVVAPPTSLL